MDSTLDVDRSGGFSSAADMNSSAKDESLDYLSAEERACLLFLEETIESLEVEDSAPLNDKPLMQLKSLVADKMPSSSVNNQKLDDEPEYFNELTRTEAEDHEVSLTPNGDILKEVPGVGADQECTGVVPKGSLLNAGEGQTGSVSRNKGHLTTDSKRTSWAIDHESAELSKQSTSCPQEINKFSGDTDNTDNQGKNIPTVTKDTQGQQWAPSEILMELFPPPSDFMDELPEKSEFPGDIALSKDLSQSPEQSQPLSTGAPSTNVQDCPAEMGQPDSAACGTSDGTSSNSELEKQRKMTSSTEAPQVAPQVQPPDPTQPATDQPNLPHSHPETPSTLIQESSEPKSPPAVAPKPKKLPHNIILRTNRVPDSGIGQIPTSGERVLLDPRRVHMEALRKLGLLKTDEVESGFHRSPSHSPRLTRALPVPPSPRSPNSFTELPPFASVKSPPAEESAQAASMEDQPSLQVKAEEAGRHSPSVLQQAPSHGKPSGQDMDFGKSTVELSPGQLRKKEALTAHPGPESDSDVHAIPQADTFSTDGRGATSPPAYGVRVLMMPNSKNRENHLEALRKLGLLKD